MLKNNRLKNKLKIISSVVLASALSHGAYAACPSFASDPIFDGPTPGGSYIEYLNNPQTAGLLDWLANEITNTWNSGLGHHEVPSVAVAIVQNGQIKTAGAVGYKTPFSFDSSNKADACTLYRIGSTTKMITGQTTMSLYQSGIVHSVFNPGIEAFLNQPWESVFNGVGIHYILTHTSGIGNDVGSSSVDLSSVYDSAADWFDYWLPSGGTTYEPKFPLPQAYNYSNPGLALVSVALSDAASASYEQLVADRVLSPAGMTGATFDSAQAVNDSNASVGFCPDSNPSCPNAYPDFPELDDYWQFTDWDAAARNATGGLMASVLDMANLAKAMLSDRKSRTAPIILNDNLAQWMQGDTMGSYRSCRKPSVAGNPSICDSNWDIEYGYGVMFHHYQNRAGGFENIAVRQHGGVRWGFHSGFWLLPEHDFAVVVLTNSMQFLPSWSSDASTRLHVSTSADDVAREAIDRYFGLGAHAN